MAIWRPIPTAAQPALTLTNWSVREVPNIPGTGVDRVLVGYCVENREGRTSRPIKHIDLKAMVCTSESGRAYLLQGPPGDDPDAEYVFRSWCVINQVTQAANVTDEVWQQHLQSITDNSAETS